MRSQYQLCSLMQSDIEAGRYIAVASMVKLHRLTPISTDAQRLFHKIPELQKVIDEGSVKIVGITETWDNEDFRDGELHVEEFNTYRCDRINKQKGDGVLM